MDVRQLQLFLAVLDCASVTRAAERVNLTPGAVSLQLHSLAAELNTELFVRAGSGWRPPPRRGAWRNAPRGPQPAPLDRAGIRKRCHGRPAPVPLRHRRHGSDPPPGQAAAQAAQTVSAPRHRHHGLPHRGDGRGPARTAIRSGADLATLSSDNLETVPLFEEELLVLKPSLDRISGWHVAPAEPAELGKASFVLYPKRSNMRSMIDSFFKEIDVAPRV